MTIKGRMGFMLVKKWRGFMLVKRRLGFMPMTGMRIFVLLRRRKGFMSMKGMIVFMSMKWIVVDVANIFDSCINKLCLRCCLFFMCFNY